MIAREQAFCSLKMNTLHFSDYKLIQEVQGLKEPLLKELKWEGEGGKGCRRQSTRAKFSHSGNGNFGKGETRWIYTRYIVYMFVLSKRVLEFSF